MAKKRVLSAPLVVQRGLEDDGSIMSENEGGQAVIGWVDIHDILNSLLSCAFLQRHTP